MEVLYTAKATAWGGREVRVASSDGVLNLRGGLTNPEQVFAAGHPASLPGAREPVARQATLTVV
jgi:osmotically inducible protein OsmC